jgi:hypothetical protein
MRACSEGNSSSPQRVEPTRPPDLRLGHAPSCSRAARQVATMISGGEQDAELIHHHTLDLPAGTA